MIINSAPNNEAVLSNVGEIGEFRIRNSAKAFNILSSGLYANKIKAIIRELSCNALDSHVAAGRPGTPFDVHLPNVLEPWFSVRDYGTGLNHEQVTNIYTTYFESTKTSSNEFIGALGLGSKSPFSYTDNFTVTAVQNGRRGIYSAFINESGVPSIALMYEEETTEANGVEVKFSVNDRWDYDKFAHEARNVYQFFKQRPVVSGRAEFKFEELKYDSENIIPGVHQGVYGSRRSVAIMGNIGYPIDIPQARTTLGDLEMLLGCELYLNFEIGELDFQASREGLSYIPQTIEAIKRKLEALNGQLSIRLATEADKIENLWERTEFLLQKRNNNLWQAAVAKYIVDTKFELINTSRGYYTAKNFELDVQDLVDDYNLVIKGFTKDRYDRACHNMKPEYTYNHNAQGATSKHHWSISVNPRIQFVTNESKIGATERAKYHFKETPQSNQDGHVVVVYVLERADKNKEAKYKEFFEFLNNPPDKNILKVDSLKVKPKVESGPGKDATILQLERRGGSGYRRSDNDIVWRNSGSLANLDKSVKRYYVVLSGFTPVDFAYSNVKSLYSDLQASGVDALSGIKIYGVRKTDLDQIKKAKNWILLSSHITDVLSKLDPMLFNSVIVDNFQSREEIGYMPEIAKLVADQSSLYLKLTGRFKDVKKSKCDYNTLERLAKAFNVKIGTVNVATAKAELENELEQFKERYPLLSLINKYYQTINCREIADYINMCDAQNALTSAV